MRAKSGLLRLRSPGHHAVIVEMKGPTIRDIAAKAKGTASESAPTNTTKKDHSDSKTDGEIE
jgi:cytochrome c551/c552